MTPAGIEPETFRFVAQHLNHCATAVPFLVWYVGFFSLTLCYIFFISHTIGPTDWFCLQRKHLARGNKLSRKRKCVLLFPFHFHIVIYQSFKPLWPCLLIEVKQDYHTPYVIPQLYPFSVPRTPTVL